MILAPKVGRRFDASCDKCRTAVVLDGASLDEVADELGRRGWLECARKGGRRKANWLCPACRPQGAPQSMGLSTAHMLRKEEATPMAESKEMFRRARLGALADRMAKALLAREWCPECNCGPDEAHGNGCEHGALCDEIRAIEEEAKR
jgi:hypothetical protein